MVGSEPVRGFSDIAIRDYRDARSRGMAGSETTPIARARKRTCCAMSVIVQYGKHSHFLSWAITSICGACMNNVDPTFDGRLKKAYNDAMQQGLWKGKYASVNHHEYFAEGVQSWFDNNRENDHDHNHVQYAG